MQENDVINVGDFLKTERLKKNISIDIIVEKTKISKSYIEKIEENDFALFPSEIYIIGFIENICEVLQISAKEALEFYRYKRSDEEQKEKQKLEHHNHTENQAIIDKIEHEDKRKNMDHKQKLTIMGLAGLVVVLVLIFSIYLIISKAGGYKKKVITPDNVVKVVKPYLMYKENESYDLIAGKLVHIYHNDAVHKFKLISINGDIDISFNLDNQEYSLSQGKSLLFDVDSDKRNDLEIKLKKISGDLAFVFFRKITSSSTTSDYNKLWESQEHIKVGKEYILMQNQEKKPISIYIKAVNNPSFLSYNIDAKIQKTQTLEAGKSEQIVADGHIEIQIGNYRDVQFFINKLPINLTIDSDKHSITKIIKWFPNPENALKYNLIIKDYVN
jgi:transcriptional regulator with XRE-family HTH domain